MRNRIITVAVSAIVLTIITVQATNCGSGGSSSSGPGGGGGGSPTPTAAGISSTDPVTALALGGSFSCAAKGRRIQCWGIDTHGQLGDGPNLVMSSDYNVPQGVYVKLASGSVLEGSISGLSAGAFHACAIVDNSVYCWGANDRGQVDPRAPRFNTFSAVKVDMLRTDPAVEPQVTSIASGALSNCAVVDGGVQCWGRAVNHEFGLDLSASVDSSEAFGPFMIPALSSGADVVKIMAGGGTQHGPLSSDSDSFYYAVKANGNVYSWGSQKNLQLGRYEVDGFGAPLQALPVNAAPIVIPGSGALDILELGGPHACAVKGGIFSCSGHYVANTVQCGLGRSTTSLTARPSAASDFTDVSGRLFSSTSHTASEIAGLGLGFFSSCLLNHNGKVFCWGPGNTIAACKPSDAAMGGLSQVTRVQPLRYATGDESVNFICAIADAGLNVYCWGVNAHGELGNGSTGATTTTPSRVLLQ